MFMLNKIDSIPGTKPFPLEDLAISTSYRPLQTPKWYSSWQKNAVRACILDMINENIRWLREEHERISKEMSIQRQHLFFDQQRNLSL